MSGYFVLDCSVTLAWFFEDEFNQYTDSVRRLIMDSEKTGVVPSIWPAEVTNVLFQAERRKRITTKNVNRALEILSQLPVEIDYLPLTGMGHVIHLCRNFTLTSYDALYLELALRRNASLATQDKKLIASAKSAGVELVGSQAGVGPG
jgi:predicted nucleic acid-binding protein